MNSKWNLENEMWQLSFEMWLQVSALQREKSKEKENSMGEIYELTFWCDGRNSIEFVVVEAISETTSVNCEYTEQSLPHVGQTFQ